VEPLQQGQQSKGVLSGLRIMVVDDEESIGVLLKEYLAMYGAQVQFYQSSGNALEAFETNPDVVDMVITDETMPGMLGMDMAKAMLEKKPSLPIILCTGYSEDAIPQSVAAIGIAAFFHKPVRINNLLERVLQVKTSSQTG